MIPSTVCGSFVGTGAAISVELGFLPDKVLLVNQTSGRAITWFRTMPAGTAVSGNALIASNGISPYAGTPSQGPGFTIGTDAVNTAGQTIAYEAVRSGPGAK